MRKRFGIRYWVLACLACIPVGSAYGDALFLERFEYEDGELAQASSNRWTPTTSNFANPALHVVDGQLTWDFTGQVPDQEIYGYYGAQFSSSAISSGSLYTYFDLEVPEAPIGTENTAGFFLALWNGSNGYRARVFIAAVPDGEGGIVPDRFRLGITNASGSRFDAVYYPEDWVEGTGLTVLVQSDFDAEMVKLYVNPQTEDDRHVVASDGSFLGIKGIAVRHRDESREGNNIGVFRVDNIGVTRTFGDIEAPPDFPPTRITASGAPGGVIAVNWSDNSNNETGFRIERRESGTAEFSELAVVNANRTHYLDESASPGTYYTYRIVALGDTDLVSRSGLSAQTYAEPETPPSPVLRILTEAGTARVFFHSLPHVIYRVDESTDLKNWRAANWFQWHTSKEFTFFLDPPQSSRNFARVASNRLSIPTGLIGLTEAFRMPRNETGSIFKLSDFGATTANSSDNDSLAFANAFAAMSFGDVLEVAAGEYHLKSTVTVPSGMTVRGGPPEDGSVLNTQGIGQALRIAPGSRDVTLEGLVIMGQDESLDDGVFVGERGGQAPERIWLSDLRIERFNRRAIQVRNAKHVKIEGCRLLNALQLGGGGFGYGVALNDSNNHNNWVTDCTIGPVIRHGILIQFSAHNNLIEHNTCFETTEDAYDLHGEDEYGNELRFNLAYWEGDSEEVGTPAGFGVGNTGATHDNSGPRNWIHHNEVRGYQIGVEVIQGSHFQFIDGNDLMDNTDAGIKIHNGGGNSLYLRRNSITGSKVGVQATRSAGLVVEENTIGGNGIGIMTTSDMTDYRIINNDLSGNETAANLGSDEGEYLDNKE